MENENKLENENKPNQIEEDYKEFFRLIAKYKESFKKIKIYTSDLVIMAKNLAENGLEENLKQEILENINHQKKHLENSIAIMNKIKQQETYKDMIFMHNLYVNLEGATREIIQMRNKCYFIQKEIEEFEE